MGAASDGAQIVMDEDAAPAARQSRRVTGSPFDPLVKVLFPPLAARVPSWISPNAITVAGVLATIAAGVAVAFAGRALWLMLVAAGLVLLNWVTDTLDGEVARARRQTSRLGDFLDHVFDAVTVAALCVGPAFSGLANPALSLLQGVLVLLCFAITYKGEQATGVYELLTFGPTEVRFALCAVFVATYFQPGEVAALFGYGVRVLDAAALVGTLWTSVYAVVLFGRHASRLRQLDRR